MLTNLFIQIFFSSFEKNLQQYTEYYVISSKCSTVNAVRLIQSH